MSEEGDQRFQKAAVEVIEALDNIPLSTAVLDEDGTIQWQNKAALSLRGPRVGHNFAEFVAPEDRDAARAVFDRLIAGGVRTEELAG